MKKEPMPICDFMKTLGEALSEGDMHTIVLLQHSSLDWVQPEEDAEAQWILLAGALDALQKPHGW